MEPALTGFTELDARAQASAPGTLFIATPERVSLNFLLAGLGSRSLAQVLDLLILAAALLVTVLGLLAAGLGEGNGLPFLVLAAFLVVNGYFLFFEGLWSGQTPGKRALHLRVVSRAGQPLTFEQALTRNLVRNVDFLPVGYAIGFITLFVNGSGKRLGDLAAGTVVVRERPGPRLADLVSRSKLALAAEQRATVPGVAVAADAGYLRQRALKDLEPALRDLVVAYASRRPGLAMTHRESLAASARAGLERALPEVVRAHGALAALDTLADYVTGVAR